MSQKQEIGITVILVTHNDYDIAQIAEYVIDRFGRL